MPIIDLPAEPPIPGSTTYYHPVQAIMLYPKDAKARLHWLASAMAGSYSAWLEQGASVEIRREFHPWLGVLWDLNQSPRRVFDDGMARVARAALSGHVLLYMLHLALHHHRHCKLERAKALVVEFAPRGGGATASMSLVEKSWADFKAVSPQWAVLVALRQSGFRPDTNERVLERLAHAEVLRVGAERCRVVDEGETYRVDEGQELPVIQPITLRPLSEELLDFLDQQFPI